MRIVLTGGGTGGHIYPAVSVGEALRDIDPAIELLFVGSSHGPEGAIARQAGIPFRAVPSSSLTKSLSIKNLASLGRLLAGVFRARRILDEFKPDAVIGTGGYTTAAVLVAQWSRRGKIIIHEQNAVPGRTNLWLSRIASKVCVTFDGSAAFFPREKVVVTGMPIRKDFGSLKGKCEARRELGLREDAFTILVVGGSQGAKRLNELVMDMWPSINDGGTQVLHQVGERNLESCRAVESDSYRVRAYLDMPIAVAAADLAISRSGASTISEIMAAKLPSILVPFPFAYADHQKRNAEYLVRCGAAVMCEEDTVTKDVLGNLVTELRSNPDKLRAMSEASASLTRVDAAKLVAEAAISFWVRISES
ncbi:MAG: undecaprenyldiphospho-muramoylpentapeptide beta-N-acetylglucosaminyltransferase [Armatimonadota bacterium]